MSLGIPFKKQFEDGIIKRGLTEALNSLVTDSQEYLYLTEELISIIKKFESISPSLYIVLNTRKNLFDYDLSSTTQKKEKMK